MKNERIIWLDGIRGLACFCIFFHHFLLSFFEAAYYGEDSASMTASGIDVRLSYEPYGVIANGNFWLGVFFVISAFLISRQIFSIMADDSPSFDKISAILCKRYPRLMLPVAAVCFINYFYVRFLSASSLYYMETENALSFPEFLYHVFIQMWLTVDLYMPGHFWMMSFLLFGSFLAVFLALIAGKSRKHMLPVYVVLLYVCGKIHTLYVSVVLAVMLAYELDRGRIIPYLRSKKWLRWLSGVFLLLIGLWLGGYPSYVEPMNFYRHFGFFAHRVQDAYQIIHGFGAFCLISSFFLIDELTIPFGTKFFQWVGKLSFAIYLIHALVISYIGFPLMDALSAAVGNYSLAGVLVFFILFFVILAAAILFHFTIEKFCDRVCRKIFH